MALENVVVVDGVRTAFARGGRGKLVATRLDEAGAKVIRSLLDRNPKVQDRMIEDVGLGNVSGRGEFVLLGVVARLAGLPLEVCSFNSNRQCGSSMETLHRIAMSIALGANEVWHRARHRAHGPAARRRRWRRQATRVSGPNPRWQQMNEVQRKQAPDHADYFSVPIPDYILKRRRSEHDADRAERGRDVRSVARTSWTRSPPIATPRPLPPTKRACTATRSCRSRSKSRCSTSKATGSKPRRVPRSLFDRDECIRPDTTVEKLGGLARGERHAELRRQGAPHHRRQLLSHERRRLGRAA